MTIENNKVVAFDYTLTLDSGEVADTSEGREPLKFLVGSGQIIPGLENEMIGMAVGDKKVVNVKPEEAYGVKDPAMIQTVPVEHIPDSINLQVGEMIQGQSEDGHVVQGQIVEVDSNNAKIDFNHPLADQALTFDIEVVEIRDASPEEIDHGHVH